MKTTLDIPDPLFRRVKARAAELGQSMKDFVAEALIEKLKPRGTRAGEAQPPWMAGFGGLKNLRRENARIDEVIAAEFEVIEPEDLE